MTNRTRIVLLLLTLLATFASSLHAQPVVMTACGDAVTTRVEQFRSALGTLNSRSEPQPSGRREVTWDFVPQMLFNTDLSPVTYSDAGGLMLTSSAPAFRLSTTNFNDVNPTYATQFNRFSGPGSLGFIGGNTANVTFTRAGTAERATVTGFGAIFSDVDTVGSTSIELFLGTTSLGRFDAPARCDATGLSFVGVTFTDGTRFDAVRITVGNSGLGASVSDLSTGGSQDVVVLDNLIFTEPAAVGAMLFASMNGANEVPSAGDSDGSGIALLTIDTSTNVISYVISAANIAAPTAAHIHRGASGTPGDVVVNFNPTFVAGTASGSVQANATLVAEILANPGNFYVNVHNAEFPGGAIRGQLSTNDNGITQAVFPVAGRVAGLNGTFFRTDLTLLNQSGFPADVVLQYYASGVTANTGPTATATVRLENGEQRLLNDVLANPLNVTADGTGAIRIVSSRPVIAIARIYNDQRPVDGGTYGQSIEGSDVALSTGTLPMLANQSAASGTGFRSNIGWFNGNATPVTATFRLHRQNGTVLETATRTIASMSQLQVNPNALFPSLEPLDNMYVTFTTSGGALYVYASVIDNKTGDAVFVPAR